MSIRIWGRASASLLLRPCSILPMTSLALAKRGKSDVTINGGHEGGIIGARQTEVKPLELHGVEPKQAKQDPEKLMREIVQRIKFGGPLTVQQYMQEVLSNPLTGYYMGKQDVFGAKGDFVTSPEISQMFGECLAVWIVHEWMKMGAPKPLNLVELGPGRGSLMSDILRVFSKLVPQDMAEIHVHLVETSPVMRGLQEATLCAANDATGSSRSTHHKMTKYGCSKIDWHHRLEQVPKEFSFFVAHEFFDALPIHKFVRIPSNGDKDEWREILVDIDLEKGGKDAGKCEALRFVRARHQTPALSLIQTADQDQDGVAGGDALEICPKAATIVKSISERIDQFGGAALIADYGNDGPAKDSFRGFRNHKLHDVLLAPGTADLTADVDFRYLKAHCSEHTLSYGPVEQGNFLKALGIEHRLQKLTQSCSAETKDQLTSAFDLLVSPDRMGARFKFLSIFPKTMQHIHQKFPPAGFPPPTSKSSSSNQS